MLQLAAAAWDTGYEEALQRLAEAGVALPPECFDPQELSDYAIHQAGRRERINRMWQSARQAYPTNRSVTLQTLRRAYNLTLDLPPDRWQSAVSHLIGSVDVRTVEQAMTVNTWFKGGKWSDLLCTPYYDLPDRIAGFAFLGRDGQRPRDEVYIPTALRDKEGGLAGLPSVKIAFKPKHVIAVADWMVALQLQLRTLRTSLRPLPMVAWRDDGKFRTRNAWRCLSGHDLIFWTWQLEPRVLMQAVDTDGQLAICGPSGSSADAWFHYMRLYPGQAMEQHILKQAQPWPVALKRWLNNRPEGEGQALIVQLEQAGADVSHMLRQCGRRGAAMAFVMPSREVDLGSVKVVEQCDCWYALGSRTYNKGNKREILNCTLKMTHVIKAAETDKTYYFGRVRYKGTDVPFLEEVTVVRDKTAQWLAQLVENAQLGTVAWATAYSKDLHQIAVMFHEPEFVGKDELWKWTKKLS